MTVAQQTRTIAELLRERRAGGTKAPVYRTLGVSPQTYALWESGAHIPGDDKAETIAEYLGEPVERIVWFLYCDRIREKGVYVSSFTLRNLVPLAA